LIFYLLLIESRKKKRKKNGETASELFFPGQICLVGCPVLGFQLLGAIKGYFEGQSLNFYGHKILST
jgi:hypothetical protein